MIVSSWARDMFTKIRPHATSLALVWRVLLVGSYGVIEGAIKSTQAVIGKEERRSDLLTKFARFLQGLRAI